MGAGNKFEELKSPYGRKRLLGRRQGQALEGPLETPLRESKEKPLPLGGRFCLRIAEVLKLECASESSGVGGWGS